MTREVYFDGLAWTKASIVALSFGMRLSVDMRNVVLLEIAVIIYLIIRGEY